MSHVTECIELYVGDAAVSDEQFRAIVLDAAARDATQPHMTRGEISEQLAQHAHALVLLNEVDSMRAGQIRVLRERLDNMEGK